MRFGPKREFPIRGSEEIFNAEYLQRLKDHDPAIEAHFVLYFKPLLKMKLSGRRLQDSDVEDVIQDTLLRTLKTVRDSSIKTPEAFGSYVSRVCDFVLYEKFREPSRCHLDLDAVEIINDQENLEQRVYEKERRKQVEKVLTDLRDKDRNLLRAKIFEGLDNDEICERFGISQDNVRIVLHSAIKKFGKAFRERGFDFDQTFSGHVSALPAPTYQAPQHSRAPFVRRRHSDFDSDRAATKGAHDRDTLLQLYHELIDRRLNGSLSQGDEGRLQEVEKTLQSLEDAEISGTEKIIEERHHMLMQELNSLTTELQKFGTPGQKQSKIQ